MEIKNADKEYLLGTLIDIEIDNLMDCKNAIDLEMVQQRSKICKRRRKWWSSVPGLLRYWSLIRHIFSTRSASGHRVLMRPTRKTLDNIINIDRSALVIAFGFPRYPKPTIVATRFLKNRGYKIVSITDKKKNLLWQSCLSTPLGCRRTPMVIRIPIRRVFF